MTTEPLNITGILELFELELLRATLTYHNFASKHEGYAVIKEELDELWDSIKNNDSSEVLRGEAIQVGAMAARFILDLCRD